jgi:hypothetical protein
VITLYRSKAYRRQGVKVVGKAIGGANSVDLVLVTCGVVNLRISSYFIMVIGIRYLNILGKRLEPNIE